MQKRGAPIRSSQHSLLESRKVASRDEDPNNKNLINCYDKLKSILLGKPQVELTELPTLIKLHFPKQPR
ncbi:hypothetical protein K7X08_005400 [Anisodus acutangulus]|uniref:DM2 domain-containing protein n=1 Tax=Anisodus acutangulus TaxID=402998 RepID=A0A9Q1LQW3_9SOLA|nr:hypothetical protein K7X08_005400 [Anisodus acutangulus]